MNRIFFHNRHDKNSTAQLSELPEGTTVVDLFGGDPIPEGVRLSVLPYLIDKELELATPGPFVLGEIALSWNALDSEGNAPSNHVTFQVLIDGEDQGEAILEEGVLEILLEAESPGEIALALLNDVDGFMPWQGKIQIEEASA